MASDAASFIDGLGLTTVDILGHSMGGEIAQLIALDRPDLVRRLVLVGTGPRGSDAIARQAPEVAPPVHQARRARRGHVAAHGSNDIVIPTINSYHLYQHLPDAELMLLPDSGHGAHFQYVERFVRRVIDFLDVQPHDTATPA